MVSEPLQQLSPQTWLQSPGQVQSFSDAEQKLSPQMSGQSAEQLP
jgi:hypothetical protein